MPKKRSVLIVYTGGTIGMMEDPITRSLKPFDFEHLFQNVPEIKRFNVTIRTHSFVNPLDSSNFTPDTWAKLAIIIKNNYEEFDGFVILHGSDTMAYTASALSFMLENLNKPVVLTGSQLPIGIIRTDGKENLITAIEIASSYYNNKPIVPEVSVYFEYKLYRGNRTHKVNADYFDAFKSLNYPLLAKAGVQIDYRTKAIRTPTGKKLKINVKFDNNIALLKLFPGITVNAVSAIFSIPGLRGVVMETYGSGNAPTSDWFINALKTAINKEIIIVNITQCNFGTVKQGKYETSSAFLHIGVVNGHDMTTEATLAKLMILLGKEKNNDRIKDLLISDICGELTPDASNKQTFG